MSIIISILVIIFCVLFLFVVYGICLVILCIFSVEGMERDIKKGFEEIDYNNLK